MTDKLRVEAFDIDLQDLARYRQTGEEEWSAEPVSLTDAVVEHTARLLLPKAVTDKALQDAVSRITGDVIRARVEARIDAVLAKPVRKTNDWGEPTGPEVSVQEMVDAEITRQLQIGSRDSFSGRSETALSRVIRELVNARLETDLRDAFISARQVMIAAAAEAGKKALAAAVTKAFS